MSSARLCLPGDGACRRLHERGAVGPRCPGCDEVVAALEAWRRPSAEHICERCGCDAGNDYFSDERCNTVGIGVCLCEVCAKFTATLSDEAFKAGGWRLGYCCRYHATGGPPQYPCGGWDHVKLRKLEPRQPNPLMVALERAYRARAGGDWQEQQSSLVALWEACDAAWGPTQTHIELKGPNGEYPPCSVCGELSHLAFAHAPEWETAESCEHGRLRPGRTCVPCRKVGKRD